MVNSEFRDTVLASAGPAITRPALERAIAQRLVADEVDLHDLVVAADLVITGEGHLDAQSFEGKVVGGVQAMGNATGTPVVAIVGDSAPEVEHLILHRSIVNDHGAAKAMSEPLWCIEHSAVLLLKSL